MACHAVAPRGAKAGSFKRCAAARHAPRYAGAPDVRTRDDRCSSRGSVPELPVPAANKFPGGHRGGVTPVPIPNTEVKPSTADGTAGAGLWESRSLPGISRSPTHHTMRRAFSSCLLIGEPERSPVRCSHGVLGRALVQRPTARDPDRVLHAGAESVQPPAPIDDPSAQKLRRAASWNCRENGFCDVIVPNAVLVGAVFGLLKLMVFRAL